MRLVEERPEDFEEASLAEVVRGLPLSVVFADGEALAALSAGGALPLEPPFHVSDQDAYLVLPDDIGMEIVDIFADGDLDLVLESLRDGAVVLGAVERPARGEVALSCEALASPEALLAEGLPHAAEVWIGGPYDPVEVLNDLDSARVTVAGRLVDDEGLERMLRERTFVGTSFRAPRGVAAEPTYAYSRRLEDGRVGIEAALFVEYEELTLVLRPAVLTPMPRAHLSLV